MKCLFGVAAVAVILQGASLACAAEEASDPTPAQVRSAAEAFDRGREAYKAEDYVEAAEQFESADANAPSAAALELAIRARDRAGQLDRAATLSALALARHPDDPNIQKIAPPIVERAKSELSEIDIKCDDPCDVTVGGKIAPGRRATERTLFVQPGTYAVRVGWADDRSLSKSVEASRGSAGALEFEAPKPIVAPSPVVVPAPVTPPPPDKSADQGADHPANTLPRPVFWAGVGLTAVMTGVTIWSGIDTQNNPGADKVRDACNAGNSQCQDLYNQGHSKQTRTNVLLGVTAGVGIATGVIGAFFTDWGGRRSSSSAASEAKSSKGFAVEPWLLVGSGASVGALGRF